MASFWRNLGYTLRVLGRHPGFTTVAVISLALGIGANTAIFSLLNALLLRDLPVRQPSRLVELSAVRQNHKIPFSYPMFREIVQGQRAFSGLFGWSAGVDSNVQIDGKHSLASVRSVTGNYFYELGVSPLLGRWFNSKNSGQPGNTESEGAVLSYNFWRSRFGGSTGAIGKQIVIEGRPFTIIGVTRRWFTGMTPGESPDITIPIAAGIAHPGLDERSRLLVLATGRLKAGVSLAQAQAQLKSFWPGVLLATTPTETPGLRRQLFLSMRLDASQAATGIAPDLRSQFTRPLYLLMAIAGLILLAACVNLANLTLARAAARSHETSVRLALGASRQALALQVLTESLTLAGVGALLGLGLAGWGSRLLVILLSKGRPAPVVLEPGPDLRVLFFTGAVATLCAIVFGLAPAWCSARQNPLAALKENPCGLTGATGTWASALVTAQVALSLVLLLSAGLLVHSFRNLVSVPLGFHKQTVLEVGLYPRVGGYRGLDLNGYHRALIERVALLPEVRSVAFSDVSVPEQEQRWQDTVTPADSSLESHALADAIMVSPGFFHTLGINIVRGRAFAWTDDERHSPVAMLSSALAKRLFPGGDPIGHRVRFGFMPESQNLEVVGVAGDARLFNLHDTDEQVIFLPCLQHAAFTQQGYLVVRTGARPEAVARAVGRQIESMGREFPSSVATVAQRVGKLLVEERAIALLSALFAGLALLLAAVGIYGVMSYTVARQTRNIGIRMALGARPALVLWSVLRHALAVAITGIVVGAPCAMAVGRLMAGMLFGISPADLPTYIEACLLLMLAALFAAYLPARRAARLDPVIALRTE
jgi:predicted permease